MITIIGGGLAGLSLGVALRRREVPVTLHEAGSYPRHRVCGEFISGVRPDTLETLGIADLLAPAWPQRTMAWFAGGRRIFAGPLPETARGISRFTLDDALRRRFEETGGVLRERSRHEATAAEGEVWCAGRIPARGRWVGLKCHVTGLELEADLEMHLARSGYAGLARVEAGRVNVCGLFRARPGLGGKDALLKHLRAGGLGALADRLEDAAIDESSAVGVAGFHLGWQPPAANPAVLGDACGMIPPFTGNGMSMAFESAETALAPLLAWREGKASWAAATARLRAALQMRFRSRMRAARFFHPFLTTAPGQGFLVLAARFGLLPVNLCFHALR